jgi:hypothetical protein
MYSIQLEREEDNGSKPTVFFLMVGFKVSFEHKQ